MKILITGSSGQLGSELAKRQGEYPHWHFLFTDLPEVDICNKQQIEEIVLREKITAIINCAAYTAVDKAETDQEEAWNVNVQGPGFLAGIASQYRIKLLHVSTDFVFDGNSHRPYLETDPAAPINIYGKTKRDGELAVLAANPDSIIIRTSWLYSAFGNNFVKTMRRLGREKKELQVVADQIGTPSWAADLARAILCIVSDPQACMAKKGVFHYSNEGVASWYDFAHEIMALSKLSCAVMPIAAAQYPTPAQRPHFSIMDKSKIKQAFNITIPHWKDSLRACIAELELAEMVT